MLGDKAAQEAAVLLLLTAVVREAFENKFIWSGISAAAVGTALEWQVYAGISTLTLIALTTQPSTNDIFGNSQLFYSKRVGISCQISRFQA
jgi:hypothetical protein